MNFINILKKQNDNGIRKPTILDGVSSIRSSFVCGLQTIKEWESSEKSFFRADYNTEVSNVIRLIRDKTKTFGACAEFFENYPEQRRQTLQHLYTFDESLYNKLRESFVFQYNSPTKHDERNQLYNKFIESVNKTIENIESSTKPEFGYCEKCKKYLDKDQKKNYPDLKRIDEGFWDYTNWS